jgi:hypothetical protein
MYNVKSRSLLNQLSKLLTISLLINGIFSTIPVFAQQTKDTTLSEKKTSANLNSTNNINNKKGAVSKENLSQNNNKNDASNTINKNNMATTRQEVFDIANYLTAEESAILSNYLDNSSVPKLLSSLMQAIGSEKQEVRDAGLDVLHNLMVDKPHLANSNTLTLVAELFSTLDNNRSLTPIFQLLDIFLEVNSAMSNELLALSLTIIQKGSFADNSDSQAIAIFFKNLLTIYPIAVEQIIDMAQKDADNRSRIEKVRVEILRILNNIVGFEFMKPRFDYMDKIFSVVLQDAQDSSVYVTNEISPIITTITTNNPDYAKKAFEAVIRSTKNEDYGTRSSGLNALKFFVKSDNTYAPDVFEVAINATKDEKPLVRWNALTVLATVLKSDAKYAPATLAVALTAATEEDVFVSITALRLLKALVKMYENYAKDVLDVAIKAIDHKNQDVRIEALRLMNTLIEVDPSCIPVTFDRISKVALTSTDEQLRWNSLSILMDIVKIDIASYGLPIFDIANKAVNDQFWFIRQDALKLINILVELDVQYAIKSMTIASKLLKDEKDTVRLNTIMLLESILLANNSLIEDIYKLSLIVLKDKNETVRQKDWELLKLILKTDAKYVQQKEFRGMIREASLDTDAAVRKAAHELLVTYLLKE